MKSGHGYIAVNQNVIPGNLNFSNIARQGKIYIYAN